MPQDTPPQDEIILSHLKAGAIEPAALIEALLPGHEMQNVIEALQRALERGKITLNSSGMVVAVKELAHA